MIIGRSKTVWHWEREQDLKVFICYFCISVCIISVAFSLPLTCYIQFTSRRTLSSRMYFTFSEDYPHTTCTHDSSSNVNKDLWVEVAATPPHVHTRARVFDDRVQCTVYFRGAARAVTWLTHSISEVGRCSRFSSRWRLGKQDQKTSQPGIRHKANMSSRSKTHGTGTGFVVVAGTDDQVKCQHSEKYRNGMEKHNNHHHHHHHH